MKGTLPLANPSNALCHGGVVEPAQDCPRRTGGGQHGPQRRHLGPGRAVGGGQQRAETVSQVASKTAVVAPDAVLVATALADPHGGQASAVRTEPTVAQDPGVGPTQAATALTYLFGLQYALVAGGTSRPRRPHHRHCCQPATVRARRSTSPGAGRAHRPAVADPIAGTGLSAHSAFSYLPTTMAVPAQRPSFAAGAHVGEAPTASTGLPPGLVELQTAGTDRRFVLRPGRHRAELGAPATDLEPGRLLTAGAHSPARAALQAGGAAATDGACGQPQTCGADVLEGSDDPVGLSRRAGAPVGKAVGLRPQGVGQAGQLSLAVAGFVDGVPDHRAAQVRLHSRDRRHHEVERHGPRRRCLSTMGTGAARRRAVRVAPADVAELAAQRALLPPGPGLAAFANNAPGCRGRHDDPVPATGRAK